MRLSPFCLTQSVDVSTELKFPLCVLNFSLMSVLRVTGIFLVSANSDLASERCPGRCSHKLIFKLELLVVLGVGPVRFSFAVMVQGMFQNIDMSRPL